MRTLFGILALATVSAASAQTFTDDFNRANGPLGANYTNIGGTAAVISSNMVTGGGANNNLSLVNTGVYNANYAMTTVKGDIACVGTALQLATFGFAHNGVAAVNNGLYIKIQSQSANGLFSHIGIYTGNGTSSATAVTGGATFLVLTSQFAAGRVSIWCTDPTTINVGIDTDFNNVNDQLYTRTLNLAVLNEGNQVGVGVWGTATIDNFSATAVPEPATMAALGLGAIALIRRKRQS